MTYDRDYILRMVREFATFLARIVRSRGSETEERTLADLDQAARTFVGLGLEALEALPAEQLSMMLGLGGTLDTNRSYAAGRLLEERSVLAESAGSTAAASATALKALELLADSALAFGEYLNGEHRDSVRRLEERLLADPATPLATAPRLLHKLSRMHSGNGEAERGRDLTEAVAKAAGARGSGEDTGP